MVAIGFVPHLQIARGGRSGQLFKGQLHPEGRLGRGHSRGCYTFRLTWVSDKGDSVDNPALSTTFIVTLAVRITNCPLLSAMKEVS